MHWKWNRWHEDVKKECLFHIPRVVSLTSGMSINMEKQQVGDKWKMQTGPWSKALPDMTSTQQTKTFISPSNWTLHNIFDPTTVSVRQWCLISLQPQPHTIIIFQPFHHLSFTSRYAKWLTLHHFCFTPICWNSQLEQMQTSLNFSLKQSKPFESNPGCLWKKATESKRGSMPMVVGQLHSARTGPDDSCTPACFWARCVWPKPDQAIQIDPSQFCTIWSRPFWEEQNWIGYRKLNLAHNLTGFWLHTGHNQNALNQVCHVYWCVNERLWLGRSGV